MRTNSHTPVIAEEIIERAFMIAFNYIHGSRDLPDAQAAQEFIADAIMQQLRAGARHPLRLANLAIAAYEAAHAAVLDAAE